MEPFKIICVTCQAKLSVRNESLIGQIVACPRCDSMVEIAAPVAAAVTSVVVEPVPVLEEVVAKVPEVLPEEASLPIAEAELLQASAEVAKYKVMVWSLAGILVGATLVAGALYTRSTPNNEATAFKPPAPPTTPTPTPKTPEATTPPPIAETVPPTVHEAKPPAPTTEEKFLAQPATKPIVQPAPATPIIALPVEQPKTAPRVARRFDPLDFDPESLTLATVDQPAAPEGTSVSGSQEEVVSIPEDVPSTLPLVRRGPDRGEDASGRNAEKLLEQSIPGVKFQQLPLVDCLRLISQLSGVPVSVSPEQLLMAGITPQKKISFDKTDVSLSELLRQVLKPLHLEHTTQGAQVVVTRKDSLKRREINYPVNDLLSEETNEKQLAEWIEQLVAPSTWKTAGGEGTLETSAGKLRIGQTQQVQYQVLILLERLRLARNLPPKSRYPVKRLAGTPANALLQKQLAKRATFTFSQYTPIGDIFVHWQTEIGVPLQIDWPALAETEVWPETTIACAILDQPWNTTLEKVLEPLGLGWRAATGGAIEITSAEKVQGELQLELYPLRRDFEGDVASLRSLAKRQAGGEILYDPVGKVLLVLQPEATQRVIFWGLRDQRFLGE